MADIRWNKGLLPRKLDAEMKRSYKKILVGIIGCGAIGSRIARSCREELKKDCELSALYDIQFKKAFELARTLGQVKLAQRSISQLLNISDLVVEATSASNPASFIRQALQARKHVLVMSAGKILKAPRLFALARRNHCRLLVPSGAIAGIDAIKAARNAKISKIILTTRKPLKGFLHHPALKKYAGTRSLPDEICLFDGTVAEAVKHFPQNINVAAILALACGQPKKIRVRILTSPHFKLNSHEIEILGDFGRILTRTDNEVCPDNPKTSYLAVLSAIETLKNFCREEGVGT